jgi:5'-nucleotidase
MLHALLSNDDGVHAAGLRALHSRLKQTHRTTVVAPLEERSTTGHSLSLDKPLRLESFGDGVHGCSGFPGDCVLMGLGHVCKGDRPQVVVSGINRGANLGQDLYYSGTIAAAREAAFHGVPAVAVSLVFKDFTNPTPAYDTAAEAVEWLLSAGVSRVIPPLTLVNVNVPDLPMREIRGMKVTTVGFRRYSEEIHARIDSRNRPYYWIAGLYEGFVPSDESDCAATEQGYISVTPQILIPSAGQDWQALRDLVEQLHASRFP